MAINSFSVIDPETEVSLTKVEIVDQFVVPIFICLVV